MTDLASILDNIGTLSLEDVNSEIERLEDRLSKLRVIRRAMVEPGPKSGTRSGKRTAAGKSGKPAGRVGKPDRAEAGAGGPAAAGARPADGDGEHPA